MTEPLDHEDDDPPCTRDAEILRLKEDVRALRGLLKECHDGIGALGKWADRAYLDMKVIRDLDAIKDRIDAELNG